MTILTVLLVDDEKPVLRAWVRALEREGHDLHTAASVEEAVRLMIRLATIHVALLDMILPGGLSGEDLHDLLRRLHPSAGAAVVSAHFDEQRRRRLEDREIRIEDKPLAGIAQLVMSLWQDPERRSPLHTDTTPFAEAHKLSPREAEILRLLVAGYKPKAIARLLQRSHATVQKHMRHTREKTGTCSTHELMAMILHFMLTN